MALCTALTLDLMPALAGTTSWAQGVGVKSAAAFIVDAPRGT